MSEQTKGHEDVMVPGEHKPLVEMRDVGKNYGHVYALQGVSLQVRSSEITCVLGDNGAGKSTLLKIVAGLHQHTEGDFIVDGESVTFDSPRDALERGIATVYQDLAVVSLMPVWRNFFMGLERTTGPWPFRRLEADRMRKTTKEELLKMGIDLPDVEQRIDTLSGGQRQSVAIARAVYFGARILLLDEPTAALGVKQSGVVLKYIDAARDAGLGVIFITHNPHHAYMVGDHFVILKLGEMVLDRTRDETSLDELTTMMAGGQELEELAHELER